MQDEGEQDTRQSHLLLVGNMTRKLAYRCIRSVVFIISIIIRISTRGQSQRYRISSLHVFVFFFVEFTWLHKTADSMPGKKTRFIRLPT
jgi:hypothetical protein